VCRVHFGFFSVLCLFVISSNKIKLIEDEEKWAFFHYYFTHMYIIYVFGLLDISFNVQTTNKAVNPQIFWVAEQHKKFTCTFFTKKIHIYICFFSFDSTHILSILHLREKKKNHFQTRCVGCSLQHHQHHHQVAFFISRD
jgi:hypothetical protein